MMMKRRYLFSLLCTIILLFSCENPETDTGINPTPDPTVPVKRVTVSPRDNVEVAKGGTKQFTATVEGTTGGTPIQSVTWSIVGDHAEGTGISTAGGLLTIAENEPELTLTVRATSTADTGKYGSVEVSITERPSVVSVEISPETLTAAVGFPCRFTAVVTVTGNADKTVEWSIEGASSGTSISNAGLVTIGSSEPVGRTLTVKATSTADRSKSKTAQVTVIANVPLPSLAGTYWWWPSLQLFFISNDRAVLYSTASYYPYSGYPFKYNYPVNGYVYSYTYNPNAKTGNIGDLGEYSGGGLGPITISADNQRLDFANYKSYGHGADFVTVRPAPAGGYPRLRRLPASPAAADISGTIWIGTIPGTSIGGFTGNLVIIHFTSTSQVYVTRTYDVDTDAEKKRVFTYSLTSGTGIISDGIDGFTVDSATNKITFSNFPGSGSTVFDQIE